MVVEAAETDETMTKFNIIGRLVGGLVGVIVGSIVDMPDRVVGVGATIGGILGIVIGPRVVTWIQRKAESKAKPDYRQKTSMPPAGTFKRRPRPTGLKNLSQRPLRSLIDELVGALLVRDWYDEPKEQVLLKREIIERGSFAVMPLLPLLKHEDWAVRNDVAEMLGIIKDVRAVQPLIEALDEFGSRDMASALDHLGDPAGLAAIREWYRGSGSSYKKQIEWVNLKGTDQRGANLSGADLSGNNLFMANLSGANLSGAYLSEADLCDADLTRADMSGAYIMNADLSLADMNGVNLTKADLSQSDLSEAYLMRADLNEANLSEAKLNQANLSQASLRRANLSGANLPEANLFGADLTGANLKRANLREANFSQANLTEANLSEVDLSATYLYSSDLEGAKYNRNTKWPKGFDPTARGAFLQK